MVKVWNGNPANFQPVAGFVLTGGGAGGLGKWREDWGWC